MDPQSDTTISSCPVLFRYYITPEHAQDLSRLVEGLDKLAHSSNLEVNKCPSFLSIGGTEKQHIDCALQDLKRDTGVDFGISDLTPAYRETITCPHLLPIMTISPNRFITFMSAEPLEDEVVSFIESGEIKHDDLNTRVSKFRDDLGIEEDYIKRIMFFGPDDQVANFMVDETRGNTMVPKAKKYFSEGFQRATAEGPLIHEPMRACRFTLEDFQKPHLKEDDQELIDTVKLAIHNITLLASPVLVEPMYSIHGRVAVACLDDVRQIILQAGAVISTFTGAEIPDYVIVRAVLSVRESPNFDERLRKYGPEEASFQKSFSHWCLVPEPLSDTIVANIRRSKNLPILDK